MAAKVGSGKRFAALVSSLKSRGHSEDSARRIAAFIGREKYGASAMARMAARGRK